MTDTAPSASYQKAAFTAVVATVGAVLFIALGIPAGPILGAMILVAIVALAGFPTGFPPVVRAPQLAIMGIAAGTTITPATVAVAAAWPLSIVALLLSTILMQATGYLVLRRLGTFDPVTAFLAAAPGSLSAVLVLAEEQGADVPRVAIPQTIRVSGIVALTPLLLTHAPTPVWADGPAMLHGSPAWAVLVAASFAGWLLARWLRWPLPPFLGCLVGSGIVHVLGIVSLRLPYMVVMIALIGLGGVIGSRFSGLRPKDVVALIPVSFALMATTAAIGGTTGVVVGHLLGIGALPGLLAFAPGSMEMMISIAVTLHIQPAYVAAHHITRNLLLLSAVPILSRKLYRR
ncbi:hypothetical protein AX777_07020 [Sphingobium yanoikuyae]|uniref:AbrB family transcriptional regulator n=1 Tax=Sphingobium yanoikuyae TaxID=13690 RepID=A0A177JVW4_SPHYA|nr:AbrB family transcriptional regulator [Sphingobium yanoikuyae]OAH45253.1 hypothetical protein AX777_07020 [Sphingobium yanoikuyae]